MRQIKILKWAAKTPEGETEESTLVLLGVLISSRKPEELPKGLDNFRLFNRIAKAFDVAEKTGVLTLEEGDYLFLRKIIEKDIPSAWGMNTDILNAVEEFINAKSE